MLRLFLVALCLVSAYAFELASDDFAAGGAIPQIHTCDHSGYGVSPALNWRNAPRQASRFALLCVDESSFGQFNHWFLADIPASVNSLPRGISHFLLSEMSELNAFIPFCPPYGLQREYKFELYALRESVNLPEDMKEARSLLKSVALDVAHLSGVYGDSSPASVVSKRSVEEVEVLVSNTTSIPSTTLNPNNSTTFTFPLMNVTGSGPSVRVIVTFTITVTSGAVCFNADFTSNATAGTPNACANPSNGSPQANVRIEKVITGNNFTFSLIAVTSGSSATFSGSYSVNQITEIQTVILSYDIPQFIQVTPGFMEAFTTSSYPAFPQLATDQVLNIQITVILNMGTINNDTSLQVCAYGGFTPISNTTNDISSAKCFAGGSGNVTISFSQNFVKGVSPGLPYVVVFGKTVSGKRNVLDLPVSITFKSPLIQAITISNGQPGSQTCDTWTVINFSFADLITK